MYNIDIYSYWNKPFSRGKDFSIRPLDDPGTETYYSKNSHNVHYLKRTDPFVFKSIVGVDYNTLVRQQKEDIAMLHEAEAQKASKKAPLPIETSKHVTHYENEKCNNNDNVQNEHQENLEKNNENNFYNNQPCVENTLNQNFKEKKFRPYSTCHFRPYNKERDFKATYGYDNITSFKSNGDKYMHAIDTMKRVGFSGKKYQKPKKKYDGFTVSEAPVIQNDKQSALFQSYNDKMGQTMKCIGGSSARVKSAMNEHEMRQNLFNQTSKDFLRQYHLPDITKIADSRQVIRRQKIGLSKEMGEKYNPYALIPPSKNRTGRNYVGDLFKH